MPLSWQAYGPDPSPLWWELPWVQKTLWSVVVLVVIWGLIGLGLQIINRAVKSPRLLHKVRRGHLYAGGFASVLAVFLLWSGQGGQFAITLSVLGAGLAFALQQPLLSLAGWLYIITNRPYDVGDRIEIGGVSGDVIDLRLFKTVLMESQLEGTGGGTQTTGRVVDVPNGQVFGQNVINYTRGFEYVWNNYAVLVTFESDWRKAYENLLDIMLRETQSFQAPATLQMQKMGRSYLLHDDRLASAVYVNILDSGIELAMRYLTPVRQRRVIRDRISREILALFDREPDLEFAYPTTRIFRREIEEGRAPAHRRERPQAHDEVPRDVV